MAVNQGQIINCKRCGSVFRQSNSPFCPGCSSENKDDVHRVYHYVLENPGLSLEDIAKQCNLELSALEKFFYAGNLGMAGASIRTRCHKCGVEVISVHRKGRFCLNCGDQVEEESRLAALAAREKEPQTQRIQVPTNNEAVKERPQKEERKNVAEAPESSEKAGDNGPYGFIRRT